MGDDLEKILSQYGGRQPELRAGPGPSNSLLDGLSDMFRNKLQGPSYFDDAASVLTRLLNKPSASQNLAAWEYNKASPMPNEGQQNLLGKLLSMVPENAMFAAQFMAPSVRGVGGARLPYDKASRMERAQSLGFDTKTTWYHGSPEPNLKTIAPNVKEPGAWFTTDIKNAANYARGPDASIYNALLSPRKTFVVENAGENSFVPSHKGRVLDARDNSSIVRDAFRDGFDSVHFPDGNFTESGNTMVVRNSAQVRSPKALFDPSRVASGRMLASNLLPLVGLGAAAAFGQSDQQ